MVLPKHVLTVLQRVGEIGLSEPILRDELEGRVGSRPGIVETQQALDHLKRLKWVDKSTDDLSGDTRWTITELGATK